MSDSGLASRRIYVPCMSDHAHAVAAAMRAQGLAAEVLPPPNETSLAIGLDVCRGRECLPCFLCVGDFLQKCREPGFDPARAVFFMPTGPGPCRFGQYHVLQGQILREQGFGDARIVSPTTNDSYALFGDNPTRLRRRAWQGIVAVDMLLKLLHESRPYELEKGATEEAYGRSLRDVVEAMETGGGSVLTAALRRAAERFEAVPVDLSEPRPLIGIVGELYVLLCTRANLEIVKLVEGAGGEVLLGTFMDWLYFVDWSRKDRALFHGDYRDYLGGVVSDVYQRSVERRSVKAIGRALRHPPESPVSEAVRGLRFCYDPALGTEAVLTMGRILDLAHHGLDGVMNVLPFSCMPGMIVTAMGPKLRERMNGLPWLDVAYDGQKSTNLNTRLEAFMHQARQFQRRMRTAPEPSSRDPAPVGSPHTRSASTSSAAPRGRRLPMLHSVVLLGLLAAGGGVPALGQAVPGASCGSEALACVVLEAFPVLEEIRAALDTRIIRGPTTSWVA